MINNIIKIQDDITIISIMIKETRMINIIKDI